MVCVCGVCGVCGGGKCAIGRGRLFSTSPASKYCCNTLGWLVACRGECPWGRSGAALPPVWQGVASLLTGDWRPGRGAPWDHLATPRIGCNW